MSLRRLLPLALPLALAACATHEVDFRGEGGGRIGEGAAVQAVVETPSVGAPGQDAADDPAVWASAAPVRLNGRSIEGFVAGTDKKAGLYIHDLDGAVLQFLPEGLLNNVDVAELSVDGRSQIVLGASDRTPGRTGVSLFIYDPSGRDGDQVRAWGMIATDVVEPYGFCFGRGSAGETYAILVGHEGQVRQYALGADPAGRPSSHEVRRFEIGSISEGCAADPDGGALYLAEENVGVWRYGLDPASGAGRTLVQPVAPGILVADAEGLTVLRDGPARYLIGSSQGDSTFPVWRIDAATPHLVGRFKVTDGAIDGVTGTDGVAALGGRVGERFPEGVVVVQDDVNDVGNQNFKYIDWRDIRRALGL